MSIQAFPVSQSRANAMCRVMAKANPTSHFTVTGQRDVWFVKETREDGRIKLHGKELRRHGVGRGWRKVT